MIITATLIEIKDGKIVFEIPDFPQPQKDSLPDDGRLAYAPGDAAKRCGIGRTTLWEDTKSGLVKQNGRGRYARKELERYVNKGGAKRKAK